MTKWLESPMAPGYEISDQGDVRPIDGEILPRDSGRGGYLMVEVVRLTRTGVHTLVADAFYGPRPEAEVVRHLNDERQDNRAENIAYGTYKMNAADCTRNGKQSHGRVKVIRDDGRVYPSLAQAARETGTSTAEIRDVLRGRETKAGGWGWRTIGEP